MAFIRRDGYTILHEEFEQSEGGSVDLDDSEGKASLGILSHLSASRGRQAYASDETTEICP